MVASDRISGVMMASIIVAVAVLEMNIDKVNVLSMHPSNNDFGFLPKTRRVVPASCRVRPVFSAAADSTKPPRKSQIRGLPQVAM